MKKLIPLLLVLVLLTSCERALLDQNIPIQTNPPSQVTTNNSSPQPLFLTTMTHMEHTWADDTNEQVFMEHVAAIRYGMDLADEYSAILTFESEQPFAKANTIWNLNIMKEILDRGHGVGTHCDTSIKNEGLANTVEGLAKILEENKKLVDALVGEENNTGCSGGGGKVDWVESMQIAGFKYKNGVVGMLLWPFPEETRPDNGYWTNEYIEGDGFHENMPQNVADRIYLITLKDASDLIGDEDGLVISNGELGAISTLYEDSNNISCPKKTGCAFTKEDTDTLISVIQDVDGYRDTNRVAKLNVYIPLTIFAEENEGALRYFFSEMQGLSESGMISWSTQANVVETYLESK